MKCIWMGWKGMNATWHAITLHIALHTFSFVHCTTYCYYYKHWHTLCLPEWMIKNSNPNPMDNILLWQNGLLAMYRPLIAPTDDNTPRVNIVGNTHTKKTTINQKRENNKIYRRELFGDPILFNQCCGIWFRTHVNVKQRAQNTHNSVHQIVFGQSVFVS